MLLVCCGMLRDVVGTSFVTKRVAFVNLIQSWTWKTNENQLAARKSIPALRHCDGTTKCWTSLVPSDIQWGSGRTFRSGLERSGLCKSNWIYRISVKHLTNIDQYWPILTNIDRYWSVDSRWRHLKNSLQASKQGLNSQVGWGTFEATAEAWRSPKDRTSSAGASQAIAWHSLLVSFGSRFQLVPFGMSSFLLRSTLFAHVECHWNAMCHAMSEIL